jgi:hypothetical protein
MNTLRVFAATAIMILSFASLSTASNSTAVDAMLAINRTGQLSQLTQRAQSCALTARTSCVKKTGALALRRADAAGSVLAASVDGSERGWQRRMAAQMSRALLLAQQGARRLTRADLGGLRSLSRGSLLVRITAVQIIGFEG